MSEARSWSSTPPSVADSRQDMAAVLTPSRRGRLPVIREIDIRLAFQLPGKATEGMPLITPLISIMESSDPKLEQAIAGTWGQYVGRSIM